MPPWYQLEKCQEAGPGDDELTGLGLKDLEGEPIAVPLQLRPGASQPGSDAGGLAAEVQAIQIGDLAALGVPGELFAETRIAMREEAPVGKEILIGISTMAVAKRA